MFYTTAAMTRFARKVAFKSYAAECDTYPLGYDPVLTTRLVRAIADDVRHAYAARFPGAALPRTHAVRAWLENQGEYTPFVDQVAVRRMVDFDWSVFDSLSGDERRAVGAKLARMTEPFGEVVREEGGLRLAEVQPARRVRYMAGTEHQRQSVRRWHQAATARVVRAAAAGVAA